MATSHTKRKRSRKRGHDRTRPLLDNPEVDHVFTQTVKFLHTWTQREIHKLAQVGNVVILPGKNKNSYQIGKYTLHRYNDTCWTVSNDDKKIQDFYDRRAAVLYCLHTHNKYSRKSEETRMLDADVGKLAQDIANYQLHSEHARKNKNWFLYDTMQARISEISSKLDYVQDQLEKSLKWAKYMKTQDGSHETTRIRN